MKKYSILLLLLLTNSVPANWQHKNISQAVFAKSVENRMPIEIITEADNSLDKIYFFTNIRNLAGDKITHRWIYQDKVKAEVSFAIQGNRWRVWSSKKLWHTWDGRWQVEVVNNLGDVLLNKEFTYKKQPKQKNE